MSYLDATREFWRRDQVFPFLQDSSQKQIDVSHQVLLYVENLSVSFDGFKALNDLNLYIDDGELRCLIGANGAGIDLLKHSEPEIASLGVGRKFQKPTVFEALTVEENVELSLKANKGIIYNLMAKLSSEQKDKMAEVLATNRPAGALSHGQKQWLEIGMLLAAEPRLLLVDEPVAGMTIQETERTAELLTSLAGERTVVVVEHDMAFVRSIAKTVTVLHQGSVLAEGTMDEVQNNQDVIEVYLGEEA